MRLVANVRARFEDFALDAALDLPLDGVVALFGPSGSGKTTLLRAIAGLDRHPDSHVALDGEVWQNGTAFVPAHRRGVGFVFQEARLFPHLSVRDNVHYGLRRTPQKARRFTLERVAEVLDVARLLPRAPQTLSAGERQRVALARAVLSHPRLLLMDEPVSALDAEAKEEILPFIQRLSEAFAIPIVYVSHAIDEVLRLAGRMALIDAGRIHAVGPIPEIMSRLDLHPLTRRLDAGAVLVSRIARHDAARGITYLAYQGGEIAAPTIDMKPGETVNVRIRARDVALALKPPEQTSILNILPGRVIEIAAEAGPQAHVLIDVGSPLWARIMKRSIDDLALAPGKPVYALIKAVAVDQRSLGRPTEMDRALARES